MKIPSYLLLVFAVARCACAQQASPSLAAPTSTPPHLPPDPLLNPVADNTRWTITTTPNNTDAGKSEEKSRSGKSAGRAKGSKPGKKPKAATMIGEKMGKMAHVLSVSADGTKEEMWTDGNLTAILTSGSQEPIFATAPVEEIPMPSWVSRKNYVEAKSEGDKNCFVFRDRILPTDLELLQDQENPGQNDLEQLKVEATALIDAETRLPVTVTEGETTTIYKFEPLAPDAEIIPAAIRTALEERGKKLQDSVRSSVSP